jgi:hypothetical protein
MGGWRNRGRREWEGGEGGASRRSKGKGEGCLAIDEPETATVEEGGIRYRWGRRDGAGESESERRRRRGRQASESGGRGRKGDRGGKRGEDTPPRQPDGASRLLVRGGVRGGRESARREGRARVRGGREEAGWLKWEGSDVDGDGEMGAGGRESEGAREGGEGSVGDRGNKNKCKRGCGTKFATAHKNECKQVWDEVSTQKRV